MFRYSLIALVTLLVGCASRSTPPVDYAAGLTDESVKDSVEQHVVVRDGLEFFLAFDSTVLHTQRPIMGRVLVTTASQPYPNLEPIEGCFAQFEVYGPDGELFRNIKPMGVDPQSADDRGGPSIQFHLAVIEAGWYRIVMRARAEGRELEIPFRFAVLPRREPTDVRRTMIEIDNSLRSLVFAVEAGQREGVEDFARDIAMLVKRLGEPDMVPFDATRDEIAKPSHAALTCSQLVAVRVSEGDSAGAHEALACLTGALVETRTKLGLPDYSPLARVDENIRLVFNPHCPVSGKAVPPGNTCAAAYYEGSRAALCCSDCEPAFHRDGAAFLARAIDDAETARGHAGQRPAPR